MINVLLVEDDPGDAFLLKEAMSQTEFDNTIYHSYDGSEAVEFLQSAEKPRPAFILLDLNMPKMSGHETLEWIKNENDFKDIPVGILTTSSSQKDIDYCYKHYASYFITKPTNFDDLKEAINRLNDFWVNTVQLPVN